MVEEATVGSHHRSGVPDTDRFVWRPSLYAAGNGRGL
jgi:hypothetical protein